MSEGITRTALSDERIDPHYRASLISSWGELGKTHHEMFRKVAEACEKVQAAGPPRVGEPARDFWDYATRYEIAAELKKKRLNGSDIQRLKDLVDEGFLRAQERPNGHVDEQGHWRPHNSSVVYKPNETVLLILAERAEKRIEAKKVESLESPRKPIEAERPWRPARVPTMWGEFGMGDPDSDQEAEKPESALLWFLGELAAAFAHIMARYWFLILAAVMLMIIVIAIFVLKRPI